ncbi:MAG TPA: metallophosphoesterase [Candidatus Moranbacteria bacterium]|nr:metallophosphoesterase [Candidatus Moranbacteria bacterium]
MNISKRKIICSLLFLIVLLGAFLRLYKIGGEAFARDEFFDINTSYGYFKTGEWLAWDFNMNQPLEAALQKDYSNTRAQLFRIPLALAYNFMEPTEGHARLISVFWGIVSIIAIYFITLSFTGNAYVALLAALLVAIGESEIIFGRRLRMYSMFFPIYLIFSWCVFKIYESVYSGKVIIFQKIYDKLKINPIFIIPAMIVGFVSYEIHELTVHIVFTLVAYCLILAALNFKKEKYFLNKYTLTLLGGFFGFLVLKVAFSGLYKDFDKAVSFWQDNYRCFGFFFTDFRYLSFGILLFSLGGLFLAFKLKRKKEALFIFLSAVVPLFYAVFSWVREPAARYIYFIQSFGIIFSASGIYAVYYFLAERFENYKKIIAVVILMSTFALLDFSYITGKDNLYQQRETSNFIDFRKVFAVAKENMKPGDVMITRAYRSFYFPNWKAKAYDVKALPLEKQNCQEIFAKIISENESGIVVLPEIDHLSVCKNGRKYLEDNLIKIPSQVSGVNIYRWDKKGFQITIATDLHAAMGPKEKDIFGGTKWKEKMDYLLDKSKNSEFIAMLGDNIQSRDDQSFEELKKYEQESGKKFIWVNGNHDKELDQNGDRRGLYMSGQKYYYVDHNNWRMIVLYNLKQNKDKDFDCWEIDKEQMAWLESTLKTENDKIVFMHCPIFRDEIKKELRKKYLPLHDLFKKYNVKYVYAGHWHEQDIEKIFDDITYRVIPMIDVYDKRYEILQLK